MMQVARPGATRLDSPFDRRTWGLRNYKEGECGGTKYRSGYRQATVRLHPLIFAHYDINL